MYNSVPCFRSSENRLILGGIDWHSYSQLIMRPYGEVSSVPTSFYTTAVYFIP